MGKWWKTWKTLPVLAWVKAAALYRKGDFRGAIRCYERGLSKYKGHPAQYCARMDLAYCLFRLREFQEAEKHLKHVASFLPQSREAHMRLARLQIWTGRSLDAAWTVRRSLRTVTPDPELIALFLYAVLDNGGPAFLMNEALEMCHKLSDIQRKDPKLEAARARLLLSRSRSEKSRRILEKHASAEEAHLEAMILFAEVLLEEGKVANARRYLRQAMALSPDHPRVLSMLAETYLKSGPFYNAEYSKQLAIQACQNTNWLSPREMHILAEAYFHVSDKIAALIVATKAKEEGGRLLGTYRDAAGLEKLIENLSTGTQA